MPIILNGFSAPENLTKKDCTHFGPKTNFLLTTQCFFFFSHSTITYIVAIKQYFDKTKSPCLSLRYNAVLFEAHVCGTKLLTLSRHFDAPRLPLAWELSCKIDRKFDFAYLSTFSIRVHVLLSAAANIRQ